MAENIEEIRNYILKNFPDWVKSQQETVFAWGIEDLKLWLEDTAEEKFELSVASEKGYIAHYELKKFIIENFDRHADRAQLAHATRLEIPKILYAIGVLHLNTNSGFLFDKFVNGLCQVITLGWKDHAELLARLGLQELMKYDIQRGKYHGGALGHGTTSQGFPYMIMDVMKDWLKADKTSTMTAWRDDLYESYAGGYGGWAELVAHWREPNPVKFYDILHRAADYHVAQSHDMEYVGHKNDPDYDEIHYEIESDKYWLYPVILFTFLRLREWEGLQNPATLQHDLFQKGIFRHLPAVPDWPQDAFYDEVDAKFRAMFPDTTPSVADLPRLRQEQGS